MNTSKSCRCRLPADPKAFRRPATRRLAFTAFSPCPGRRKGIAQSSKHSEQKYSSCGLFLGLYHVGSLFNMFEHKGFLGSRSRDACFSQTHMLVPHVKRHDVQTGQLLGQSNAKSAGRWHPFSNICIPGPFNVFLFLPFQRKLLFRASGTFLCLGAHFAFLRTPSGKNKRRCDSGRELLPPQQKTPRQFARNAVGPWLIQISAVTWRKAVSEGRNTKR